MDNDKFIYIDESGIHKTLDHSSFVLIYVKSKDISYIQTKILELEKILGISHFHWSNFSSKYGWNVRKKFINGLQKLPFKFKYLVLKNSIKPNIELSNLLNLIDENNIREIHIDGKQPRWIEGKIKKNLRDRGLSIEKIKTVSDESEAIIRIADAIENVVRLYYDQQNLSIIELFNKLQLKQIK